MSAVFERLRSVFQDVFPNHRGEIQRTTSAKDVEDWDSLMHVNLIVTVEKEFGIRLKTSQIAKLQNVGELSDLVEQVVNQ